VDAATATVVRRIAALPRDWPRAGSFQPWVFERLIHHAGERPVRASAETGTGRSTLLFSHLSARHLVFTKDDRGAGDSLADVQASDLLRREAVEFVLGPTQETLPSHCFADPLQLVLIDGPHAFPCPQLEYHFLAPHLETDGLLVVDDLHLRSVNDLFRFLRADAMFRLLEVAKTTAFFRRTEAPAPDPSADGWWLQRYNQRRWPPPAGLSPLETLKALVRRRSPFD